MPDVPEDASVFVWAGGSEFRCGNAEDYEDELPDDVDLSPVESRGGGETTPTVVFSPGEELPPSLAKDIWSSFNDRIATFDEDGSRVGRAASAESEAALDRWAANRGRRLEEIQQPTDAEEPEDDEDENAD